MNQREAEEAVRFRLYGFKRDANDEIIEFETDEITEAVRERFIGYRRAGPKGEIQKSAEMQSQIEEEPSISAETRANIEALKPAAIERLIRKQFPATYKDEKKIAECKYAPNKPCVFSYEAEREALGCSEDQPCRVEVMTLEDVKKLIGDA